MIKAVLASIPWMVIGIGVVTTPALALEMVPFPVPEPTSLTLLASGVAGLLVAARFARRK